MNMKCRIWDTQNNRFWTDINEAYKGRIEQLLLSPSGDINLRTMDGITHESVFPGRFIKSWYTGLQDRNGKEIYEGDILQVPDLYETPENTSTTYHNETIDFKNFTFNLGDNPLGEDYEYISDECEVIGNIYDNPDLLGEVRE